MSSWTIILFKLNISGGFIYVGNQFTGLRLTFEIGSGRSRVNVNRILMVKSGRSTSFKVIVIGYITYSMSSKKFEISVPSKFISPNRADSPLLTGPNFGNNKPTGLTFVNSGYFIPTKLTLSPRIYPKVDEMKEFSGTYDFNSILKPFKF